MNKLLICVSLLVALFVTGCGSTKAEKQVVLDVTPARGNLDIGTSNTFYVTSPKDPTFTGATWTLVGAGQLTVTSPYQVMYTAPEKPGAAMLVVTSINNPSETTTIPISVDPDPAIANSTLPTAILGKAYNAPVTATGGVLPLTWSILTGTLPPGLAISAASGSITGIPTTPGTWTFRLDVTDSGTPPFSSSQMATITVAAPLTINPITFPAANINLAYSVVPTAAGGVTPYTWSINSGSLPAGVTLNPATGAISGTPTLAGNSAFSLQVSDSSSPAQTATASSSISVQQPLSITTSTLPNGTSGIAYSASVAAVGGVAPLTWSVTSGSLPNGLTLSSTTGTISGTPSSAGLSSFSVRVSDSSMPAQSVTLPLAIQINAAFAVSNSTLPNAIKSVPYIATLLSSGGSGATTWSVTTGTLPTGLSLSASTGVIAGIPTAAGSFPFTIQAKDSANPPRTATQSFTVVVNQLLSIGGSLLVNGTIGLPYSATASISGGTAPFNVSVTAGALPAGLSLNATTGAITGTPTIVAASNFTLQVTDSSVPAQTATLPTSISINAVLSIGTTTLPNAVLGISYSFSLTATGAVAPLTWSVASGSLPAGLSLNASTGAITGIPTLGGAASFKVQVTDSAVPPRTATAQVGITVNVTLSIGGGLLPNAINGIPYIGTPTVSGGVAPFTWSVSTGTLPTGLTLNTTTGLITGIPTASGTSTFTLHVTDSSVPAQSANLAETIVVNGALAITLPSFPDAIAGIPYVTILTASGGTLPDTWSISAGTLPAGLTLNATTGLVSGTASVPGTYNFTVKVTDSSVPAQTKTFATTIRVDAPLTIGPISLPGAILGLLFNGSVTASGGVGPLSFSVSAGALPAGLTLNAATGVISGIPTTVANTNFTIQVQDSSNPVQVKTANVALQVSAPLAITSTTLANAITTVLYGTTLTTTGGTGAVTWAVSAGTLPTGLTLNATTGVIAGTPSLTGTGSFTVQATDSSTPPQVKTAALSIQVNPILAITSSTLPNAISSLLYGTTLTTSGGVGPITWSITSGGLPAGITLNAATGNISGITTVLGPSNFTVQAKDSSNPAQTKSLTASIQVNPVLAIASATLPNAVTTLLYGTTLTTTGGTGAITWAVSAGTLPSGLTLNATTGVIAGTPLLAGTGAFTIQATDSSTPPQVKTASLSIQVNTILAITSSTLPNAISTLLYGTTLSASGGSGAITWSVTAGALPIGMTLNATTGAISGISTVLGPAGFTVQARDSGVPAQTKSVSLSIVVNPVLSITSTTLPNAILTVLYGTNLSSSGGSGAITWSVTAGALPSGLTLNAATGAISGTPLSVGAATFTVTATDSATPPQVKSLSLGIQINSLLGISLSSLPNAVLGNLYSTTLAATGGVAPITWSVTTGSLPLGLSLNSNGVLSGTPTALGNVGFTIQAKDSSNPPQTKTAVVSILTNPLLSIVSSTLPDAVVGVVFNSTLTTSGGVAPINWAVTSGTLPTGIALNATTGVLSGTPSVGATGSIIFQATDSSNPPQVQTVSIGLNVFAKLAISPITLPPGLLATLFDESLSATGGDGPYTWSVSAGSLPSGITLNTATGALSGTPLSLGAFSFTIQAQDSAIPAQTATLALSLSIASPGVNNALLAGDYAFMFQGADANNHPVALVGSFVADGAGSITSGVLDISQTSGVTQNVALTSGNFILNSDNRGTLTITTALLGTQNFRMALNAGGTLARFIEFDEASPETLRGNGVIKKQNPAAFSDSGISSDLAFGFEGATSTGGRSALVGSIVTNGAGKITSGLVDSNSNSTINADKAVANTSTYAITGSSTGRGTVSFNIATIGTVNGVLYVVSSTDAFFMRTDALAAGKDLLSGELLGQSGGPFGILPLGTSVLHLQGNSTATTTSVGAGLVVSTGLGALTGTFDSVDNGVVTTAVLPTGTSSINSASAGRGALTFAGHTLALYYVNPNEAFVMDSSGAEVKTGMLEGQSGFPLTLLNLTSQLVQGSAGALNSNSTYQSGIATISSVTSLLGNINGTVDTNGSGDSLVAGNLLSAAVSLATDGRITAGATIYYVVSGSRVIAVEVGTGNTEARILVEDK